MQPNKQRIYQGCLPDYGLIHILRPFRNGLQNKMKSEHTNNNTSHVANQFAKSWISDVLKEEPENGLEQNIVAPRERYLEAVAVYELLY